MRKRVSILLMLLAAVVLLAVSCNGEASLHEEEELVSVCFGESSSRALSASLDSFADNKALYFWAYAAKKMDGSNFVSGETANYGQPNETRVWVKTDVYGNPVAGITDSIVSGFSQGIWEFSLYAYVRTGSGTGSDPFVYGLVYKGESQNVVLKNSGSNPGSGPNVVPVTVSPVKDAGNGTLAVSVSSIVDASTTYADHISKVWAGYVPGIPTSGDFPFSMVTGDLVVSLLPGTYTVKVKFDLNDNNSSVVSTIVVTVYSNLTTTVDGKIDGVVSTTI